MARGFKVRVTCAPNQFHRARDEWQKIMAHAATTAIRQVGINARDVARDIIASAGFGPNWYNSIVSTMHPRRGEVLNPYAWVHSKINFSDVFETGKTITPRTAKYIWIPTASVPKYPGTGIVGAPLRQMDPKTFTKVVGPLKFIHPPGKSPMLIAPTWGVSGSAAKRSLRFRANFSGRSKKQIQWTPMFVGVASVTIQKRFDVMPAVEREAAKVQEEYAKNIAEYRVI